MVLEKTLGSPLDCKEIQPVHSKGDQPWVFFERNDAVRPPHAKSWLIGKDSDAGSDLGAGGEGDDRGWDGWMASLTRWMWVWVDSGSWWWTGRPGVLWFMGLQRVGQDWATKLNWTELKHLLAGLKIYSFSLKWSCGFFNCNNKRLFPIKMEVLWVPEERRTSRTLQTHL